MGISRMACRAKCPGEVNETSADGRLIIAPTPGEIVHRIFWWRIAVQTVTK